MWNLVCPWADLPRKREGYSVEQEKMSKIAVHFCMPSTNQRHSLPSVITHPAQPWLWISNTGWTSLLWKRNESTKLKSPPSASCIPSIVRFFPFNKRYYLVAALFRSNLGMDKRMAIEMAKDAIFDGTGNWPGPGVNGNIVNMLFKDLRWVLTDPQFNFLDHAQLGRRWRWESLQ